eukprot:jgi/Botrbrau1/10760/Bobra.180_2s0025.1
MGSKQGWNAWQDLVTCWMHDRVRSRDFCEGVTSGPCLWSSRLVELAGYTNTPHEGGHRLRVCSIRFILA